MNNMQSWADICDNDIDTVLLPPPVETIENGIKTTIYFRSEDQEDGSKKYFKVTETSRIITVQKRTSKKAKTRRGIPKFGDCEGLPTGPEHGVTIRDRNVIEFEWDIEQQDEEPEQEDVLGDLFKRKSEQENLMDRLVPEHLREKNTAAKVKRPVTSRSTRRGVTTDIEETPTIRISDLPRDTTFHDLLELVQGFRSSRIKLPRDPTGENENRGFAFVAFSTHDHAEKAKKAIDGHAYGTNILHCEWSRNYLNYLELNPLGEQKKRAANRQRRFHNSKNAPKQRK